MSNTTQEILSITQEECAEVIQAISKVQRFGFTAYHPGTGKGNKEHLEEELGDLKCMIDLLIQNKIVDEEVVNRASEDKLAKLKKWSRIFDEVK
jgi:NTP pyrophosphatase (non-canonical NTP hydrolase)